MLSIEKSPMSCKDEGNIEWMNKEELILQTSVVICFHSNRPACIDN